LPYSCLPLFDVKTEFQTSAQLANANIVHTTESPFEELVQKLNPYQFQSSRNANEHVNLVALVVNPGNLDAEVAVDVSRAVCQTVLVHICCHLVFIL
jgi:hypothetical protein